MKFVGKALFVWALGVVTVLFLTWLAASECDVCAHGASRRV